MYWIFRNNYIIVLLCFALWSCQKQDCLQGAGKQTEVIKDLADFTHISINGIVTIILTEDTINRIRIQGGKNIVANTEISIADSSMYISHNTSCYMFKNQEHPLLYIHVKSLRYITINEASALSTSGPLTHPLHIYMNASLADITIELNTPYFSFSTWNKAGGRYQFSGYAETAQLRAQYISQIYAPNLHTKRMKVTSNSIQDFYVWAEEELQVRSTKEGIIYYKGNPLISGNVDKVTRF